MRTQFPKWQQLLPHERQALSEEERELLYRDYVDSCRGSSWGNTRLTTEGSNQNPNGWGNH